MWIYWKWVCELLIAFAEALKCGERTHEYRLEHQQTTQDLGWHCLYHTHAPFMGNRRVCGPSDWNHASACPFQCYVLTTETAMHMDTFFYICILSMSYRNNSPQNENFCHYLFTHCHVFPCSCIWTLEWHDMNVWK